jgi:DNA-binding MarR family transcriptional regulator
MQDERRLVESLPHAIVRLFRMINRAHNRALKPHGLSAEQAHVLCVLWIYGPMTMGALQRHLALSSPTLTGAIDRMEAQKLVHRVPNPDDGRAWLLEPEPAANRKRGKIEDTLEGTDESCFAALTATERRELGRLLAKCIAGME